jgi:hypothetical protein
VRQADCNYTYANYRGRFLAQNLTASPRGPNSGSSRWYSFELGPVHFAAIDTDAYGFDEVAYVLKPQYEWLAADLAAVDREATPFVVLMGHRPMYCSSSLAASSARLGWPKQPEHMPKDTPPPKGYGDGFRAHRVHPPAWAASAMGDGIGAPSCGVDDLLRNGMHSIEGGGRVYGLEPLMAKYGVDVYLTGHEHFYERLWPTINGSYLHTYDAPGWPVHVLTGSGGAYSKDTLGSIGPWDAFRSGEWSYSDIFVNRTHFELKQRLATNSTVIDHFVLKR